VKAANGVTAVPIPGDGWAPVPAQYPATFRLREAASPTAERSELRGELRRVVYGGVKSVRHESRSLLNERQRFGRRKEAGRPRKQHGKIEQDAEEGVSVIADLKRFDAKRAFIRHAGDSRHALHKPPRQDLHPKERYKKDRDKSAKGGAEPTAE
jgi:hypothetical protein